VTAPTGAGHSKEVQVKTLTKATKPKTSQSRQPSRSTSNKTGNQQHALKPVRSSRGPVERTSATRPQSKQAEVIALLRRPEGVTVAEIVSVTGWQPHTVRGLFSETLKKKLGLAVNSAPEEGRGRVYRIIDRGDTGAAAGTSA
jgi:Protein of unknown function (DUF3489)